MEAATAAAALASDMRDAIASPQSDCLSVRTLFLQWASTGRAGPHLQQLFAQVGTDAGELWHIVLQSLWLEEAVASGSLLLQALALVRMWKVHHNVPQITMAHEQHLSDWRKWMRCPAPTDA